MWLPRFTHCPHLLDVNGTSSTPFNSLLNANLPIKLLGDRSPVDLSRVKASVYTSKDNLPTILRAGLSANAKRELDSHHVPIVLKLLKQDI